MCRKQYNRSGLTLVELLGVVSILGILLALLFPLVGKGIEAANQTAVANNLHQIALARFSITDPQVLRELDQAKTANEWVMVLAQESGLTDVSLYVASNDPLLRGTDMPKIVGATTSLGFKKDPRFCKLPLCLTIIKNLPAQAPRTTTPMAYTRGLEHKMGLWKEDGKQDTGVWGATGGFIVFLDGHVQHYKNLDKQLLKYGTLETTASIKEASPPGATAIAWHGTAW